MRTLLISLMAVGLFAASSCVNEGGQVFGELPEGVVPVSGEALEARGAVYNKDLNELKISWRTTPDPKLYKGVRYFSGIRWTVEDHKNYLRFASEDYR